MCVSQPAVVNSILPCNCEVFFSNGDECVIFFVAIDIFDNPSTKKITNIGCSKRERLQVSLFQPWQPGVFVNNNKRPTNPATDCCNVY